MIQEILTWLLQRSDLKPSLAAISASDFLLVCYLFSYLINRKAVFISVFLFSETLAYSTIMDLLPDVVYYLLFAGIYSILYHYLYIIKSTGNSVLGCAIIIIFNIGAALDAKFYPEVETIFYNNYESIVVGIHLYFIYTTINWKLFRSNMGKVIDSCFDFLGVNYYLSLFCYNNLKNTNKDFKL